ncbi:MAG TPA: hypothetical protein VLJ58_04535 [Ramlibacter sp.]|nr:hypothetical protein [Ramlibacter sp.]
MPLKGTAAIVIWGDMQDPTAHDDWHSHEHLLERVRLPGFLRGRRMVAAERSAPRYIVLYEVADTQAMTSPAYLEKLNRPTDWTRRVMGSSRGMSRTLCAVRASYGLGVGSCLLAITPQAGPGKAGELHDWLAREGLPSLPQQSGLTGAHLLLRDSDAQRPRTHEERMRGRPDASVDTLVLVEGYDLNAVRRAARELLAEAGMPRHGASGQHSTHLYMLAHALDSTEAAAVQPG